MFIDVLQKSLTPVIRSLLNLVRIRAQEDSIQVVVLETLTALCRAVKPCPIIVRMEGGIPLILSLFATNIRKLSFLRNGLACLHSLVTSPPNATAFVKAGGLQPVLHVLNDKDVICSPGHIEASACALQLLSALVKSFSGSSLPGTLLICQAVVNTIYARISHPSVVTAATDFLFLIVKRPVVPEEAAESVTTKNIEALRRAGGVDAMFVIVGRYSDSFEVFKGAYFVLNRLLRRNLTANLLGEFTDARSYIDPERRKAAAGEESFPSHLAFPESDDSPATNKCFLDAEHASHHAKGRALPPVISGIRQILQEGGIPANRSKIAGANHAREPFLPPAPDVLAEVMLLNVARWLRTSDVLERDVYVGYATGDVQQSNACMFDAARRTVWADSEDQSAAKDVVEAAEALVVESTAQDQDDDREVCSDTRGEDADQDAVGLELDHHWDDVGGIKSASMDAIGGEWPAGPERVSRSARSARQRDSIGDASDGDEDFEVAIEEQDEEEELCEAAADADADADVDRIDGDDDDDDDGDGVLDAIDGDDCDVEEAVKLIDAGLALDGGDAEADADFGAAGA
jgi:hypothetical protein